MVTSWLTINRNKWLIVSIFFSDFTVDNYFIWRRTRLVQQWNLEIVNSHFCHQLLFTIVRFLIIGGLYNFHFIFQNKEYQNIFIGFYLIIKSLTFYVSGRPNIPISEIQKNMLLCGLIKIYLIKHKLLQSLLVIIHILRHWFLNFHPFITMKGLCAAESHLADQAAHPIHSKQSILKQKPDRN